MPFRDSPACVGCDSEYECRSLCPAGVAAAKDGEIAALKAEVRELETEIKFTVETIPDHVIVREGGGPENWAASLAVSVRKLLARLEDDEQAKSDSRCSEV